MLDWPLYLGKGDNIPILSAFEEYSPQPAPVDGNVFCYE